jgi:predicted RNA methylase
MSEPSGRRPRFARPSEDGWEDEAERAGVLGASELVLPHALWLGLMVRNARAGRLVPDSEFDRIYPDAIRRLSPQHWTPVKVARRAAQLLVTEASTRVLDVGAGAGKFCLVGALTSKGRFTGVEQRGHLVHLAREVAREYGVTRARYVHADMREVDWGQFDAVYLFNPFAENNFGAREHIDATVAMSHERYARDVAFVYDQLARAREGTRVVTYYGFGGEMPPGYERKVRERAGTDALELWVRTRT